VAPGVDAASASDDMNAEHDCNKFPFNDEKDADTVFPTASYGPGVYVVTLNVWDDNHLFDYHDTFPDATYVHPQTDDHISVVVVLPCIDPSDPPVDLGVFSPVPVPIGGVGEIDVVVMTVDGEPVHGIMLAVENLTGNYAFINAVFDDEGRALAWTNESGVATLRFIAEAPGLAEFTVHVPAVAIVESGGFVILDWPSCHGDLDGDYDVDLTDLARLLANYGMTSGATIAEGDLDYDGDVDLSDLAALLAVYGTTCAPPPGDSCDNPVVATIDLASLPYMDANYTCGRGDDYQDTCLGAYDGGEDIIYELEVPEPMAVNIILDPLGTPWTGIALSDTCPLGELCIAMSTSGSSADPHGILGVYLEPGVYYVMIDTWPEPDCIPQFTLTIERFTPVENDDCEHAMPTGEEEWTFDTSLATFDGPGFCMTSPNIWYCYTPSCAGLATVSLCGSMYDTMLAVYDGCTCEPIGTLLDCNDDFDCDGDGHPDLQSQITFEAIAGGEYLIEVGGSGDNTGPGMMTIAIECGQ